MVILITGSYDDGHIRYVYKIEIIPKNLAVCKLLRGGYRRMSVFRGYIHLVKENSRVITSIRRMDFVLDIHHTLHD